MKKSLFVTTILFTLLPSLATATTCIHDEEQIAELSAKHQPDVAFEIHRSSKEFDIEVDFPANIDGMDFSGVVGVNLVNDGVISFMAPLSAVPVGEKLHTWFVVGLDFASKFIVEIAYRTECGLVLRYDVPFSEADE